jgi:hypothetical protein
MAKQYQATHGINRITSALARLGIGRTEVLTTTGRKTVAPRRFPVSPIVLDGSSTWSPRMARWAGCATRGPTQR